MSETSAPIVPVWHVREWEIWSPANNFFIISFKGAVMTARTTLLEARRWAEENRHE